MNEEVGRHGEAEIKRGPLFHPITVSPYHRFIGFTRSAHE
jgi:hypothetical protein